MPIDLNIVTLNIPYPADHGGMIDIFYRIKSLHCIGVRIHLHCFEYGRAHPVELESLCETIVYYQRKTGFLKQFSPAPYIVVSRKSKALLANLLKNDFPVFFDGLHTTSYISHPSLLNRMKLVRMHNIEHLYYNSLAKHEQNLIRKLYYIIESVKLKQYEKRLLGCNNIFAISENDNNYFNSKYHNSVFIAPFHPFNKPICLPGTGDYILFHGDLSVNENSEISYRLISGVFSKLPYKCYISGKNPPEHLLFKASQYSNIEVIPNPDDKRMTDLILNAQINILPALSFNGFKLKLLLALYSGRHCIVNSIVAGHSALSSLYNVTDTDEQIIKMIHSLMLLPFTEDMIREREILLSENYNNIENARKIMELVNALLVIGEPACHKLQSSPILSRHRFHHLSSDR